MLPTHVVFRTASQDDCSYLLRRRDDPTVRAVSHATSEIDLATYSAWLKRTLDNPHRLLLIAELKGEAIGVVRFDQARPQAPISVYRVPGRVERCSLVRATSDWIAAQYPEIRRIVAEVLPDNAAFQVAG
ncbi:hypothetical protein [Azonexus sp. IMCC34839]|uniref:hypothetical protein n=1 Tax=Azonexus sp. IMCC34839 TaxID=3133695 RepID=UPI00399A4C52